MIAAFTLGMPIIVLALFIDIFGFMLHALAMKDTELALGGAIVGVAVTVVGAIIGTIIAST